jgi:hypothetical protein
MDLLPLPSSLAVRGANVRIITTDTSILPSIATAPREP